MDSPSFVMLIRFVCLITSNKRVKLMKPTPIMDDEACWQAVVDRDRLQDGKFVTAVHTTGIYCRPSCPARSPHRQNVAFYRTPAEAEAAGFRACKRCSPNTQAFEADLAEQICRYV